jgi:hypothetical protein
MATTEGYSDGTEPPGDPGATAVGTGPELVSGAVGDRCSNCGSPLASDQHYCVECGQRRGKPRFSVAGGAPAAAPRSPKRRRIRRPAGGSGATLVAGIATLLLAMGVGVEIGRSGNTQTTTRAAAPTQVITVGGGGSGTATATTASTTSGKSSKSTKTRKAKKVTKVVVQKTNNAASKALGTSAANLVQNPTVTSGQSCTGGAGCQNGHFTGNFFGSGGG